MSKRLIESPVPATVMQRLDLHAATRPGHVAFRFLSPPSFDSLELTFRELRHRALRVARMLRNHHAAGNRVLLVLPPGEDYLVSFLGCLYAGAIAVPLYPPRPNRVPERFLSVAESARPRFAIASAATRKSVRENVPDGRLSGWDLQWLEPTGVEGEDRDWSLPYVDSNTPAFLQYTSGSTAEPKGVVVTHRNLEHNIGEIGRVGRLGEAGTITVSWLPPFHDMGLIAKLLAPVFIGFTGIVMPAAGFIRHPLYWLEVISRFRGTGVAAPNFAFDLCVDRIEQAPRRDLDLSSLRVVFNGSEPVRKETMARFANAFGPLGFRPEVMMPCYGLAESTLIVSAQSSDEPVKVRGFDTAALQENRVVEAALDDPSAQGLVSCGKPIEGMEVRIVDVRTQRSCDEGQIGEIWLRGPSVARGYWGNRESTAATFRKRLHSEGEGTFLHTGDLGFLLEGELYITGRQKDLIVIAGRNHYPQDIEVTARESHPALAGAVGAAFSMMGERGEELGLVHEVPMAHRGVDGDEIIAAVRQGVAKRHELAVEHIALVQFASLPKTSSGKIRRARCREMFLTDRLKVKSVSSTRAKAAAPPSFPEMSASPGLSEEQFQRLRKLVADVLKIAPESLDPTVPLTQQGLSSLRATELQCELEESFAITIQAEDFFDPWTVHGIADQIAMRSKVSPRDA